MSYGGFDEEWLAAHQRRMKAMARVVRPLPGKEMQDKIKPSGKRKKYRNEVTERNGLVFASKKEADRWLDLELLVKAGEISDLRAQVPFILAPAVKLEGAKRIKPALRYFADAVYVRRGVRIVEDTKSPTTRKNKTYRVKLHLMKSVHGIDVLEV